MSKVILYSEELGARPFSPEHAKKLLALQKRLKVDHWKPAQDQPKNETNGSTGSGAIKNPE